MSIIKDFSNEQLLSIIQEELSSIGSRIKVVEISKIDGHSYIIAKTSRGSNLVVQPVCIYPRYTIGIRAIHRIVNRRSGFSYMPNGQGGRNLDNILFNGEEGKTYSTEAVVA